MKYYKRSYRRYKRNYYKRKYKYSKYNTYRHRSSAAQASQIYGLNKRINKIEKLTKPEYREFFTKRINTMIVPSSTWRDSTYNLLNQDDTNYLVKTPATITGDSIRLIKLIVWGSISRIPGSIANHLSNDDFKLDLVGDQPVLIRILIGTLPKARSDIPTPAQFFKSDNQWSIDNFKAPLLKGAGNLLNIKKYKRYSFDLSTQITKTFKFTVPLNGLICKRVAGEDYPSNNPLMFVSLLNNEYTNHPSTDISVSYNCKIIYTDA